jgi:hypothetical protein
MSSYVPAPRCANRSNATPASSRPLPRVDGRIRSDQHLPPRVTDRAGGRCVRVSQHFGLAALPVGHPRPSTPQPPAHSAWPLPRLGTRRGHPSPGRNRDPVPAPRPAATPLHSASWRRTITTTERLRRTQVITCQGGLPDGRQPGHYALGFHLCRPSPGAMARPDPDDGGAPAFRRPTGLGRPGAAAFPCRTATPPRPPAAARVAAHAVRRALRHRGRARPAASTAARTTGCVLDLDGAATGSAATVTAAATTTQSTPRISGQSRGAQHGTTHPPVRHGRSRRRGERGGRGRGRTDPGARAGTCRTLTACDAGHHLVMQSFHPR